MAMYVSCTLEEFYKFIDPKIRNYIQSLTKQKKRKLGSICEECGKVKELEAAHIHGRDRKKIIKIVLDGYEFKDGKYIIPDLEKVLKRIHEEHLPLEENFRFLCKPCHTKYDAMEKRQNINTQTKEYLNFETSNNSVMENPCKDKTSSWKYKIGWTSIENRKNIERLISKIEADLDCYPYAFKSWYFHNRRDNRKQFSGIICHKNRSEICFRVDPRSFSIEDNKIIHGKRWFFSEGKEKRIKIVPENYDLIMECLHYAYQISE